MLGRDLQAYASVGIRSDHEAYTLEEGRERLRAGMWVLIREASVARNLRALAPLVAEFGPHRLAFCTDDREPEHVAEEGHVNSILNSLKMTWSGTIQHRSYSNCDPNAFRGDFFEDLATIEVTATTPPVPARNCPVTPARHGFRFVSDPADKGTTTVHFAQIGREKNGVFY